MYAVLRYIHVAYEGYDDIQVKFVGDNKDVCRKFIRDNYDFSYSSDNDMLFSRNFDRDGYDTEIFEIVEVGA